MIYPFDSVPGPGEAAEVAPGVLWLRMPLPMSGLDHINVWALRDGEPRRNSGCQAGASSGNTPTGAPRHRDASDGSENGVRAATVRGGPHWTLVDTGMHTPHTAAHWRSALASPLGGGTVRRVISTHMHPDHVGMAGWLAREFGCPLWMTRLEYLTCRMLVADTGREAPEEGVQFYRTAGWDAAQLEHYQTRFGGFGRAVYALPDSYRRIADGEMLQIGTHEWQVVVGRGHSPEHACLYSPVLKLLISGDQVLPRITSNVSVFPTEPAADPLADWLDSLADIRQRLPDDVLVLPSHNEPFRGLHERLDSLIQGHEQRLARVRQVLREPKRAVDLFSALFRRAVDPDMLSMATGESLAHLNCLMGRGQVTRQRDTQGIAWYRSV